MEPNDREQSKRVLQDEEVKKSLIALTNLVLDVKNRLILSKLDQAFLLTTTFFSIFLGVSNSLLTDIFEKIILLFFALFCFVGPFYVGYVKGSIGDNLKYRLVGWRWLLGNLIVAVYLAIALVILMSWAPPFEKFIEKFQSEQVPVAPYLAYRQFILWTSFPLYFTVVITSLYVSQALYPRIGQFYSRVLPSSFSRQIASYTGSRKKRSKRAPLIALAANILGWIIAYLMCLNFGASF